MKPSVQIILCLFWLFLVFQDLSRPQNLHHYSRNPKACCFLLGGFTIPELAAALDQGLRDFWQKPDQVLDSLGDLDGLLVADIGCGEGYFSLPLLERVGPQGKVYATDIQPEVLEVLAAKIPDHLLDRAELILSTDQDTEIPTTVDLIMVIQVLGEVNDQHDFFDQLKKIMHDETRLVLIDSKHITDRSNGYTRPLNMYKLQNQLKQEGFVLAPEYVPEKFDFLPKQFYYILKLGPERPASDSSSQE